MRFTLNARSQSIAASPAARRATLASVPVLRHVRVAGWAAGLAAALFAAASAPATVFLNEILINPPGSGDATEFIELLGAPGRKLDGYAIATLNGGQQKTYPLGSIPPRPEDRHEIDELFSLDGLRLGANGILVLTQAAPGNYASIVPHSNAVRWTTLWNGGLAAPSSLENDGSNTIVLIRRRPGVTEACGDPEICGVLRWAKNIRQDDELAVVQVGDPPADMLQYGTGSLDNGDGINPDDLPTVDMKGFSTPGADADDLEVVDEVSYEHDAGWEFDIDDRHVDVGSAHPDLPERRVHALDDPAAFNPDCLTRVDYRTKGPGWPPVAGGTGQMSNGNNWQDTATEQWIRGDSRTTSGSGSAMPYFFINTSVLVPTWLNDGQGVDYDFGTLNSYQLMAGRVNPLATAFIPGDVDRDGDCDADDIAKIAAVFGDNDWIFSNAFEDAPQGDSGDPATQTRPWDVDCTGDNGIEPTDVQWVLNFQGNANGRIVGVTYDSATPAASGVVLNPNTGVQVTVSAVAVSLCGRPLNGLFIGDQVQLTVSAQVTAGANNSAGEQNGVMQFVHDLALSTGGVLNVAGVTPVGPFSTTRASIQQLQGGGGSLGVHSINGHTTSFTQGLGAPAPMYQVTLVAVAAGSTTASVGPASLAKFAASTPTGVKLGRTRQASGPFAENIGDPATATYPASGIALTVVGGGMIGDIDNNGDVNFLDVAPFVSVLIGAPQHPDHVARSDLNCDGNQNGLDIAPMVDAILNG